MKPAAFAYHRPRTLAELNALLVEHGEEGKVIAGGQSLGPMMNMRLAQPAHLIDLNDLAELAEIRDGGDHVVVGALARHHDVAESELLRAACPLLAQAAAGIGHYAIRQRGTMGGSLAHADPAAQLPLIAATLGATIEIAGPRGRRELPASEFFLSIMTTALDADEIITGVRFPKQNSTEGWAFDMFSRRHGDFAIVAVATTVELDGGNRVRRMRFGLGGVDAVPLVLAELAAKQAGATADNTWIERVAADTEAVCQPDDSPRIPAAYRRELVRTLTARALRRAVDRAQGKERHG